jgi:hypothetical protein
MTLFSTLRKYTRQINPLRKAMETAPSSEAMAQREKTTETVSTLDSLIRRRPLSLVEHNHREMFTNNDYFSNL